MTTVGYGDTYARTNLGRVIIFIIIIFGVFIVSMMTVTLQNSLIMSNLESKVIVVLEKLDKKDEINETACLVIKRLGRLYIMIK